jgi:hypothetical protein
MTDTEKIPVYIRIKNGKTICICHAGDKGCDRRCDRDVVTREIFRGWQNTMKRNRYGQ